jgi:hypothetical protein
MLRRRCRWLAPLLALALVAGLGPASAAEVQCPQAQDLPQLTIDKIQDPAVPVIDNWQVFWGTMPLSDYQLAELAGDDVLVERTREEISGRGTWVYLGTLLAAAGTGLSSFGWVLYGQGKQSQSLSLSLALGGIVLGAAGLLTITNSVQTPLEPLLAPTPEHRLTREEVRALVSRVNLRLYREICEATSVARATPARNAAASENPR